MLNPTPPKNEEKSFVVMMLMFLWICVSCVIGSYVMYQKIWKFLISIWDGVFL